MGLLRLGWITNFLSHSVICGFMTGASVIIALSQVCHHVVLMYQIKHSLVYADMQAFMHMAYFFFYFFFRAYGITLVMPLRTCLMTRHAVMHMSHDRAYCHTHGLQLRHVVHVIAPQQKLVNHALCTPADLLPVTKCCPCCKAKPCGSRGQLAWLVLLSGYEATLRTKSGTDLTIRKSAFAI